MAEPPRTFPHRHNPDGTHDSICSRCFAKVATAEQEVDLLEFERAHVCKGFNLDRMFYPADTK